MLPQALGAEKVAIGALVHTAVGNGHADRAVEVGGIRTARHGDDD